MVDVKYATRQAAQYVWPHGTRADGRDISSLQIVHSSSVFIEDKS